MSEHLDLPDSPVSPPTERNPARHARRVLVALLAFGTLVVVAVVVIASLLRLGGALDGPGTG